MSKVKPFYESRKKQFTCHIWKHPNYPIHLHKHLEFCYVSYGEMTAKINGEERVMKPGDAALIFPNVIHTYSSTGEVGLLLIIADMDYIGEFYKELATLEMPSAFFNKKDLSLVGQGIIDLLLLSTEEINPRFELQKGMLVTLLSAVFESLPMIKRKRPTELGTTEKLLLYINDNIRNPLQAKDVSKALGLSTFYISHIFSKELGISFSEYVMRQRLTLARDLIKDTKLSITDIAVETGFSNTRTFQRSFKTEYNMTPTQWRKMCNE